jgi:hypothetical protein
VLGHSKNSFHRRRNFSPIPYPLFAKNDTQDKSPLEISPRYPTHQIFNGNTHNFLYQLFLVNRFSRTDKHFNKPNAENQITKMKKELDQVPQTPIIHAPMLQTTVMPFVYHTSDAKTIFESSIQTVALLIMYILVVLCLFN